MDNQLGQINVTTLTNPGLPGFTFQLRTSPHLSSGLILTNSHRRPIPSISVDGHVCSKVLSIISRMSHFAPFISSGRLHLRFLQFWFKNQWSQHQQSWDTPIELDGDFLSYLHWFQWPTVMTGVPLHLPEPSLLFFTDASLKGWGASWKDNQISELWSTPDSQRHINWLELEAIRLALLQWVHQWRHQSVRVYCDNSTAVLIDFLPAGPHGQWWGKKSFYQKIWRYLCSWKFMLNDFLPAGPRCQLWWKTSFYQKI